MINSTFTTDLAIKFDLNSSVLISAIFTNLEATDIDGRFYFRCTIKQLALLCPWWTEKQLRLVINKAVDYGLIKKGFPESYPPQDPFDKTTCYSYTHELYSQVYGRVNNASSEEI